MNDLFHQFFDIIRSNERFLVTCHVHPDGDAIGSLLAIGLTIAKQGKTVEMVCMDGIPSVYNFLDCSDQIKQKVETLSPDVIVCVDCAEKERVALPSFIWDNPGQIIVNIDHHITNLGFGDLNIIDPQAAATGELIFRMLTTGEFALDKAIASAIYTATATDTGFFRYSSTTSYTLELASILVKNYQVEPAKIAEYVHEQKSYNSIRLLGDILNTLQLGNDGKTAWMVLDQQMLSRFPVENEETESYVNYARSIEGVEVGLLFKELKPNEVRVSWRSTSAVDVSKLAAYFGGGGHARAAGCSIVGPIDKVVNEVITYVNSYYGT